MNYAQYLLAGGTTPTNAQQDQLQQLVTLAEQFKSDPEGTLSQIGEENIEPFIQAMTDFAEQTLDQQLFDTLQSVVSALTGQTASMKCGGKVKQKVKKACGGKKLQMGNIVLPKGAHGKTWSKESSTVFSKGGCPCHLKKVGGRLIEVDCNDIPVAKLGIQIKQFQSPADPSIALLNKKAIKVGSNDNISELLGNDYFIDRTGLNKLYYRDPNTGKIYSSRRNFGNAFANYDKFENWAEDNSISDEAKSYYASGFDANGKQIAGDLVLGNTFTDKSGRNTQITINPDGTIVRQMNYGAGKLPWNQDVYTNEQHGNNVGNVTVDALSDEEKTFYNAYMNQQKQPVVSKSVGEMTAGEKMFRGQLAPNILTDYSLQGRKNWLSSQDNADYLASLNNGQGLGFDANNYTGTAAQNRALLTAMQGRATYQPAVEPVTAAEQAAVEPVTASEQAAVAPTTYTNQQLLDYTGDLSTLGNDNLKRLLSLNYQKAQNDLVTERTNIANQNALNSEKQQDWQNVSSYFNWDPNIMTRRQQRYQNMWETMSNPNATLFTPDNRIKSYDAYVMANDGATRQDYRNYKRDVRAFNRLSRIQNQNPELFQQNTLVLDPTKQKGYKAIDMNATTYQKQGGTISYKLYLQ